MSAARVRREKQLAAAVADEQAARAELERVAREEELRPARQALANAISRRDDKCLELEDAKDKVDTSRWAYIDARYEVMACERALDDARNKSNACTRALDDAIDCKWGLEKSFAVDQAEVDKARKTLNALQSGDDKMKNETTKVWDAGV